MDGVDLLVPEQLGVRLVPPLDPVGPADLVELVTRPLTDGDELGLRVPLVDRDELGPEAEAHDRGAELTGRGGRGRHGEAQGVGVSGLEGDCSAGSSTCVGCRR